MSVSVASVSPTAKVGAATSRVFFPNLNGLRFIAALMVIVHHVEQFQGLLGMPNVWENKAIENLGGLGVTLFFALSGFLITYLLLVEKEQFGRIALKDFYLRRALRIWPLYYVVVIAALFILPHIGFFDIPSLTAQVGNGFWIKVMLYFLMLPNVALQLYAPVPYASQTWSIGIEEQFYLIWPLIIGFARRYWLVLFGLAAGMVLAQYGLWFFVSPSRDLLHGYAPAEFLYNFLVTFRIQCMCIGGLFAVVMYNGQPWIKRILVNKVTQILVWGIVLLLLGSGITFPRLNHEIYATLFGIIIYNLCLADTSLVSFKGKILDYLGKISYSLYMLHSLTIVAALRLMQYLLPGAQGLGAHLLLEVVAVGLTIGLAAFSYRFIEKPFLTLKHRFARVKSGS